jgi:hypothetical protein
MLHNLRFSLFKMLFSSYCYLVWFLYYSHFKYRCDKIRHQRVKQQPRKFLHHFISELLNSRLMWRPLRFWECHVVGYRFGTAYQFHLQGSKREPVEVLFQSTQMRAGSPSDRRRRRQRVTCRFPPCRFKVKNAWNFTSIPITYPSEFGAWVSNPRPCL